MTKITFLGAGSLGFTRGLVRDILTFPLLQDATLSLMDIDAARLDFAYRSVKRILGLGNYPAKVEATLDRVEALRSQIEEMAVEAALTGDPRLVFQAVAHDPLTASVLSLAEIRQMVNQMLEQNRPHLPQFKYFTV